MGNLELTGPFQFHYGHETGQVVGRIQNDCLRTLYLLPHGHALPEMQPETSACAELLRELLARYFQGIPEDFARLVLDWDQGTEFQRQVWLGARQIPWGATASYGDLAARLGRSTGAARAIGHALGRNPFHLIVPCHRFLSNKGELVAFAGGLEWKRVLLQCEGSLVL